MEETGLMDQISSGVVLTGGAMAMVGMSDAAEEILGLPVRIGMPVGVKGFTQLIQGPQHAAAVGLVRYGAQRLAELDQAQPMTDVVPSASTPGTSGRSLWNWLRDAF